jgi:signal recognition particle subunit SRP54
MFDFLSEKFSSLFNQLTGAGKLTEHNIETACQAISQALVEADVSYELVQLFVNSVKKEAIGKKIPNSVKPAELFLNLVHGKLIEFLGGTAQLEFSFQLPSVVMVLGLQGSGKTTTVAKLARFSQKQAQKRGKKRTVLLASVDFYRPAAIDQLEQLASTVGVSFYRAQSTSPVGAAQEIYAHYKQGGYDLLFLDTAGRLHVDDQMLKELSQINALLNPRYKFLVLDAMTGQESLAVARAFNQVVGFDAGILTKMDSDTRGGAAFSFRYALHKPIHFVGKGEKIDDFDQFFPKRAAGQILGMGDLQSLAEKADEVMAQQKHAVDYAAMTSGKMTLQDFADQMSMMGKIGSMSQLMKYMPGMGGSAMSAQAITQGELEMKRFLAILSSMTPKERLNPRILDASRKKRIAHGAGVAVNQVNLLLQRFEQVQQYAKLFKKQGPFGRLFS